MGMLTRLAGVLADTALGLPLRATPYSVERDVAVPMPDGVTLVGDHYRPAGTEGGLPVVLIRLPYARTGLFGLFVARSARAACSARSPPSTRTGWPPWPGCGSSPGATVGSR